MDYSIDTFDWEFYIKKHKLFIENITNKFDALQHWYSKGKSSNLITRYKINKLAHNNKKLLKHNLDLGACAARIVATVKAA